MGRNWEEFGEKICKTVQDAIENKNYDQLNQVISETINQAVDTVVSGVKRASAPKKTIGIQYTNVKTEIVPFEVKAPSGIGAILGTVLGYIFGGFEFLVCFGFLAVGLSDFALAPKVISIVFSIISFICMVSGLAVGIWGTKRLLRLSRFKNYVKALGSKTYCNISELAGKIGKTDKYVVKDLEYMIKQHWFVQGHLDKQKTCLIVTDKLYAEYCQLEQRKALEQKEAEQRAENQRKEQERKIAEGEMLGPEVQKIIAQGEEYVRRIRRCNELIPGEEISEKIERIEILVNKIFDRVKQEPRCVSDIRKLMEYYLPTTVKLLEAYAEMDAQPVGGENIENAKREIEATLDTLNTAFEKLLDSLFQEKAWDISSDISVLNTMLAQEGLKDDGMKK